MSKTKKDKQLLNEATVRSFMKLAKLGPLSENFFDKIREEEEPEEMESTSDEAPMEDVPEKEPLSLEQGNEQMITDLVQAIADAVESTTGVEVNVDSEKEEEVGEATPEEMDVAFDDIDISPEEDAEEIMERVGEVCEEEKVEESKEFGGTKDAKLKDAPKPKKVQESKKAKLSKKQLFEEVAKRVAARLLKGKK